MVRKCFSFESLLMLDEESARVKDEEESLKHVIASFFFSSKFYFHPKIC